MRVVRLPMSTVTTQSAPPALTLRQPDATPPGRANGIGQRLLALLQAAYDQLPG